MLSMMAGAAITGGFGWLLLWLKPRDEKIRPVLLLPGMDSLITMCLVSIGIVGIALFISGGVELFN